MLDTKYGYQIERRNQGSIREGLDIVRYCFCKRVKEHGFLYLQWDMGYAPFNFLYVQTHFPDRER